MKIGCCFRYKNDGLCRLYSPICRKAWSPHNECISESNLAYDSYVKPALHKQHYVCSKSTLMPNTHRRRDKTVSSRRRRRCVLGLKQQLKLQYISRTVYSHVALPLGGRTKHYTLFVSMFGCLSSALPALHSRSKRF